MVRSFQGGHTERCSRIRPGGGPHFLMLLNEEISCPCEKDVEQFRKFLPALHLLPSGSHSAGCPPALPYQRDKTADNRRTSHLHRPRQWQLSPISESLCR